MSRDGARCLGLLTLPVIIRKLLGIPLNENSSSGNGDDYVGQGSLLTRNLKTSRVGV